MGRYIPLTKNINNKKNTTEREGIHVIYLQGDAKALSSLTCTSKSQPSVAMEHKW